MSISLKKLQEEGKVKELRFKETMTPGQLNTWLKYVKSRVLTFKTIKELEKESEEFLDLWEKIKNFDSPKRSDNSWDQGYWLLCVDLDFRFITLYEKYTKLQAEGKIERS